MSLKERFGSEVWHALVANSNDFAGVYVQWATVGEVAKGAKVSRATAKKYLDILVSDGHAKSMKFGKRTGYCFLSDNAKTYQE